MATVEVALFNLDNVDDLPDRLKRDVSAKFKRATRLGKPLIKDLILDLFKKKAILSIIEIRVALFREHKLLKEHYQIYAYLHNLRCKGFLAKYSETTYMLITTGEENNAIHAKD